MDKKLTAFNPSRKPDVRIAGAVREDNILTGRVTSLRC